MVRCRVGNFLWYSEIHEERCALLFDFGGRLSKKTVRQYAAEKGLTTRRSRSALHIDQLLVQKRQLIADFMSIDEVRMRQLLREWPLSPHQPGVLKAPLCIGLYGLLAYPGALLESIDENHEARDKTRLLIKVTVEGTIFHLLIVLDGNEITPTWHSQEYRTEQIRLDALSALKKAVKDVTEYEIPKILTKVKALPV